MSGKLRYRVRAYHPFTNIVYMKGIILLCPMTETRYSRAVKGGGGVLLLAGQIIYNDLTQPQPK